MPTTVTRLPSRVGSYASALTAFRQARLSECLGELHGLDSQEASVLAARAALRLGDPKQALLRLKPATGDRQRAENAMLRGAALLRTGRIEEATTSFIDSRTHVISAGDSTLEAELAYYMALLTLGQERTSEARAIVERALETTQSARHGDAGSIIGHLQATARLHEISAIIEETSGQYRDAFSHARIALTNLNQAENRDIWLEAYAVQNLAIAARDFDLHDASSICQRVDDLPWTPDISRVQFTATRAATWCAALRGNVELALLRLRRASEVAVTAPLRVTIALDRAVLSRESGFNAMASEEIQYALRIARAVAWNSAPGDDRIALLHLAQVVAPFSAPEARSALDRYSAITVAMDPRFSGRTGLRVLAEESFGHGLVLRAEGRLDASAERLRSAFETWQSIGYEWRSAQAALELAEMNAGDGFRLAVRRDLKARPDSVFSARARLVA